MCNHAFSEICGLILLQCLVGAYLVHRLVNFNMHICLVTYIYLVLLLWTLFVVCVSWLSLSYCIVNFLQPCGHLLGKG